MTDVLRKQQIAVSSVGEIVKLQMGNIVVSMTYETALQLSQWLRFRGKEAKRRAGDMSRNWRVIGQLHDAQYGPDHTRG